MNTYNNIEDKKQILMKIDFSNHKEKNFARIMLDNGINFENDTAIEDHLELKELLNIYDLKKYIPDFLVLNVLTLAKNKYPSQLDDCAKIILEKIKKSVSFFENVDDITFKKNKEETFKMFFKCKRVLNKMTKEEISDISDKKEILSDIDFSDPTSANFVAIILSLGSGYTSETLTNEKNRILCEYEDYDYRCEIGNLVEKYKINEINYNILDENVLDFAERNYPTQLHHCAKIMLNRIDFCFKVISSDINNDNSYPLKNKIENIKNKCETILREY